MKIAACVALTLLFASSWAAPVRAQAAISPQYYDLDLAEAQGTHAFRIHNYTKAPKQVQVSVLPWRMDEDGQPQMLEPAATTLDQWVVVNPVTFTVAGESSQAVRFSIRPAVDLPPGEHRVMLIFDEILPKPIPEGQLRARFQFRSAVYVQVGTPDRSTEFAGFEADGTGARITLRNVGSANARFRGQYAIWPQERFPGVAATALVPGIDQPGFVAPAGTLALANLPSQPVLPGDTRVIRLAFPVGLEPGRYVLDLNGTLGGKALDREFGFEVAPASAPD